MNIKTILIVLMAYNIYRLWCFYLAKDKVKMRKAFYGVSAFLVVIIAFYFSALMFFSENIREVTTSPVFVSILKRLNRVLPKLLLPIERFITQYFWHSVAVTVILSVFEFFFKHHFSKEDVKHGPRFGVAKTKEGILVGRYNRNVLPKQVRKFAPGISVDIRIPYNRLSRGITILGDMGSGKSRLMAAIEQNIRERYPDIPILIHDPKGEWLSAYYDAKTDIIFAPYDKRSVAWSLWDDFKKHPELRHPIISTAIESHHSGHNTDRFWSDSGILLLKDITQENNIFRAREKLISMHKKNQAEGTWMSILTTSLIGFRDLAAIELMNFPTPGISIDKFLNHRGRIFLLNNPSIANEQHGALTLLLSAFMIRALSGTDVGEDKLRAAVIIDEALTFHLSNDVERAVFTQSRSKGLCVVAGAQRLPKENQGERGAWSDHPVHIFGMRVTDLNTRQILAKRIGGITYDEKQKSVSSGDKSSSKTESETQRQHDALAPEDWALQNREFVLFHEQGIAPGRVRDVSFDQRDDINIIKYNPRKDVSDFMDFDRGSGTAISEKGLSDDSANSAGTSEQLQIADHQEQKFKLTIDLVPQGVWFSSIAQIAKKTDQHYWWKLKDKIIKDEGKKCWICGEWKGSLDVHEFWEYDDSTHTQTLIAIHHLCRKCHMVKHFGRSTQTSDGLADLAKIGLNPGGLVEHFLKINNCSAGDFEKHKETSFRIWKMRSQYKWTQHFGEYHEDVAKMIAKLNNLTLKGG